MKILSTFLLLIIFLFICIRLILYYKNYEYYQNYSSDSLEEEKEEKEKEGSDEINKNNSDMDIIKDGSINYIIAKPVKIREVKMKDIKIEDKIEDKKSHQMQPIIINIKIENDCKTNKNENDEKKNKRKNIITQQYLNSPEYLHYGSPLGSTDNAKIKKETMNIFTDQDPYSYTYMKNKYYTFPQQRYSLTEIENLPKN